MNVHIRIQQVGHRDAFVVVLWLLKLAPWERGDAALHERDPNQPDCTAVVILVGFEGGPHRPVV